MSDGGWVVVRIIRVRADDVVHEDLADAERARDALAAQYPNRSYALAHTTLPLG